MTRIVTFIVKEGQSRSTIGAMGIEVNMKPVVLVFQAALINVE